MPGHGSLSTGTEWAGCGAFPGYQPVTAGWNSHVEKPLRRHLYRAPPRTYPRSATAAVTTARVASGTDSGRFSTAETVPVDKPARRATSTSFAPGWRAAGRATCLRDRT
jgi:hypothetical protein